MTELRFKLSTRFVLLRAHYLVGCLFVFIYICFPFHVHGVLRAAAPVGAHSDREPSSSSNNNIGNIGNISSTTRGLSRWSFPSSSSQPTLRPPGSSRSSSDSKGRNRFRPSYFALHTPSSVVSQTCPSDYVVIYLSTGVFALPAPSLSDSTWLNLACVRSCKFEGKGCEFFHPPVCHPPPSLPECHSQVSSDPL